MSDMSPLRIYLSGSIKKGRSDMREAHAFWTESDEAMIHAHVDREVVLLNPAKTPIRRNDYFVNYGCDLYLVGSADVILVDLRTEKGIGVGAELMYAHLTARPVIGWLPRNSYYRRDKVEDVFGEDLIDWVHPFAFGLCDLTVETLTDACNQINLMNGECKFAKNEKKAPERAIEAFRSAYAHLADD